MIKRQQLKKADMTAIILRNGSVLNVNGTATQIAKEYNQKQDTKVLPSRINDNQDIWIKGLKMGEIQCK